jgi:peptidyl-prolyl cis-trans isomerase D
MPEQLMPYLISQAAQQMIIGQAQVAEARRIGLKVTDDELRNFMRERFSEQLFPQGQFIGDEAYRNMIEQNTGMSVEAFEREVKQDILRSKLEAMIEGGVLVPDSEVQKEFRRQNMKVKLQYAVLTLADLEKQIHPSDAELKAFYDKNKARYTNAIPEKRKANFVVVDTTKVQQQIESSLTNDEIQRYYNQNRDQYRLPEQVKVRHILIATRKPGQTGEPDQKTIDAARAKAQDVLKQVQSGGNFAELAKKYSEDPGSKDKGGELGWIQRGQTVPEFEKAAFSLTPGQTSGLVQSSFGFHIIQVEQKQEAGFKPLTEVRSQIAATLAQQKAASQADALASKVQNQARVSGLDKAAADAHLDLHKSDFFIRTEPVPPLGVSPEFADAVFNAQVNGPPQTAHTAQGYIVFVVTADQPARTPSFDEWRAKVEQDFKAERAQQLLTQKTQELADRAHASHDLAKAAKEEGATVKTSDLVGVDSQVPDIGTMSGAAAAAFDMNVGEISGPVPIGSTGIVFQVAQKQEPSAAEATKSKDQIRDQLLARKRQERYGMFVMALRDRMEKEGKIKINQDEWNRLTGGKGGPRLG